VTLLSRLSPVFHSPCPGEINFRPPPFFLLTTLPNPPPTFPSRAQPRVPPSLNSLPILKYYFLTPRLPPTQKMVSFPFPTYILNFVQQFPRKLEGVGSLPSQRIFLLVSFSFIPLAFRLFFSNAPSEPWPLLRPLVPLFS